jgi:hypothetical protein
MAKKPTRASPATKTTRKPKPGTTFSPHQTPKPAPLGDPDTGGAALVPIDRYGWPRPRRWSR